MTMNHLCKVSSKEIINQGRQQLRRLQLRVSKLGLPVHQWNRKKCGKTEMRKKETLTPSSLCQPWNLALHLTRQQHGLISSNFLQCICFMNNYWKHHCQSGKKGGGWWKVSMGWSDGERLLYLADYFIFNNIFIVKKCHLRLDLAGNNIWGTSPDSGDTNCLFWLILQQVTCGSFFVNTQWRVKSPKVMVWAAHLL